MCDSRPPINEVSCAEATSIKHVIAKMQLNRLEGQGLDNEMSCGYRP
jgi:hypothetical protein